MKAKTLILTVIITAAFSLLQIADAQKKTVSLSSLSEGELLHGFKVIAVYLADANQPMGARFVHVSSGFTLDVLQIESVPQAFIYVNTFPVSDMGEPHAQEHLLVSKGNKGRQLNTKEGMSLARDGAFTTQLFTAYHFNTGAGPEVFYSIFEKFMDALLYPDYTDEEVRREVRNWGVTQSPDKILRLVEKGSVYNEMSNTMNNPYSLLFDTLRRMLYGSAHPLSYNAGGLPAGIRLLTEKDIARYHQENYYLGNMGAITSLPAGMKLDGVLDRMNNILDKLDQGAAQRVHPVKKLPPPHPAESGKIVLIDVPIENAQQPGTMLFAYPPVLNLDIREYIELSNFLSVFAGDASTNLYKIFVDSKTRQQGMDAQGVYGNTDGNQLYPVFIWLEGVKTENLTEEKAKLARERIITELEKIAAYPDHSPELLAFNKRFENGLTSLSRDYAKFVNNPPKFGFRNTYSEWYHKLDRLSKIKGFKKSIGFKPQIREIRMRMAGGANIWKEDITKWKLSSALPYVVLTKANPALVAQSEAERNARADAEVKRLRSLYHLDGDQEAISRYKAVYDSNSMVLEKLEQAHKIKFIEHPPLTLDDRLQYQQQSIHGNIPLVASVFNNMTSATTGIALKLDGVPRDKLVYLAILPDLLTQTGILKNSKAVSYEEMIQQIKEQILSLDSYYSTSYSTDRAELVVKAAGNDVAEARRSLGWMNDVLKHPYWTMENLPRIRDLVEQDLSDIRKRMQDAEESWVGDPNNAYIKQNKPLILATSSFLTRAHNIFRLKWMLTDAGSTADSTAISTFLSSLADASTSRDQLTRLLSVMSSEKTVSADSAGINKPYAIAFNSLPAGAKTLAKDAALDLAQLLNDIPDESLSMDWKYLCQTIRHDLAQTPGKTLNDLNELRESLLKENGARLFVIGSEQTELKLKPAMEQLLSGFSKEPVIKLDYPAERLIDKRVKERMNTKETIVFAGLINQDSHTGVFYNSAPLTGYKDTQRGKLLALLAAELYAGEGKQSVFSKTIGAGLAYSNGIGASTVSGRFIYYAERTPELPQTLSFVINEVKHSPLDTTLLDYVVSLVVGGFRSADDYESRGEAMAADLADGQTPELIRKFREAVLRLRKEPGLIEEIYKYKDSIYETVLPGYGKASKDVNGGSFFVIGPEKQMAAYEAYLKSVEGQDTKLYRLYPRDFWMIGN